MKQDLKAIIKNLDEINRLAKECNKMLFEFEKTDPAKTEPKQLTLEEVRAILAEKSQDGFTAEVRALLEKHGAKRLSEIDPANYKALLQDAEALKND